MNNPFLAAVYGNLAICWALYLVLLSVEGKFGTFEANTAATLTCLSSFACRREARP